MPLFLSVSRSGWLSYALSAISFLGLVLGRPGPNLGTLISFKVASASLTSAGEAESTKPPNGTP